MPSIVSVMPESERKNKIEQATKVRTRQLRFEGSLRELEVKRISINLPVYRMANMRTDVLQLDYVRESGKDAAFFSAGQEDPEAQAAQHDLLLSLAREESRNVYRRLESEAAQTEELVMSSAGVIVNGNRRLAAMRELFRQDSTRFQGFENIEVVVLPDADESALTALETDLQIAEDLRLPYGWVEEARGLRRQLQVLGWSMEQAKAHWGKTERELNALQSQLELAEEYLAWLGKPQQFREVAGDEQVFETLQRHLASATSGGVSAETISLRKKVAFARIASPEGTVAGSAHSFVMKLAEITDRVVSSPAVIQAAEEAAEATGADEEEPSDTEAAADDGDDDPLDSLPEDDEETAADPAVTNLLGDAGRQEFVAAEAARVRDDILDEERQQRRAAVLSQTAEKINSQAAALSLTNAPTATLQPAAAQLVNALLPIAECIRDILAERPDVHGELDWPRVVEATALLSALQDGSEAGTAGEAEQTHED